jgi:AraC-like DNA-binding protein
MAVPASSTIVLVRQCSHALFRSVLVEKPTIVLVRAGRKVVHHGGRTVTVDAGMLCVLPARLALTIENCPPPKGTYTASALLPDTALVDEMLRVGLPGGDPFAVARDDRAIAAFERAAVAVEDPLTPNALRDHAVREVLLWLAEAGIGFGPARRHSVGDRLRTIVSAGPQERWTAPEAARSLALSEATLRRRLVSEGTSFRDLLADVRMTQALGLLQTTNQPINAIALAVGYASPSRFAARFRERFGLAPSAIRETEPRIPTLVKRADQHHY